ncbi:hypothetical protein ACT453_30050, partial [Bacillus sp. D-CC]
FVVIPSSEMLRKKDIEYRIGHGEVKAFPILFAPFINSAYVTSRRYNFIYQFDRTKKFVKR